MDKNKKSMGPSKDTGLIHLSIFGILISYIVFYFINLII